MSQGKIVVVTGASAGLGRAIAHGFAKRGAHIGLIARNPEALGAAKQECEALGGEALILPLDVSDPEAVDAAASRVELVFGPIDIWVNDAMVSVFSPVKDMEASDYKRVTEVLYLGFVHGTLSALKRMLPRDKGTIIQIGSALSYRSIPLQSAYCACKHAINGFTDSLRCELYHDNSNVQLTAVQMPAMNTTQFDWVKNRMPNNTQPVPPIFEPELAAEVVVAAGFAARPRREYWVGSPTVAAIIGQMFIPGILDYYLGKTGYKSQQIPGEPKDPNAPNNLYDYVPGKHSARGKFTDRSTSTSAEVFATLHRPWFVIGGAMVLAAAAGAVLGKRPEVNQPENSLTGNVGQDAVLLGASCLTVATLIPVLLYQTNVIRSLPDPPSPLFDSDEITKSRMAPPAGIPDSIPGLASFGTTLALVVLAKQSRVARRALGAKLLLDGSAAAFNVSRQVVGFAKLCSWCTGTALAAFVTVYAGHRIIAESLSGNWSGDQD